MTRADDLSPRGLTSITDGLADPAPRLAPLVVVVLTATWGLWALRSELVAVPYLDDSSMHQQMVRFAATRMGQGHLPLTSWFPYLGLGSPHFQHYQSLAAMAAGLAGLVGGADAAFRWSIYLMWALWPVVIYASARLFGLSRWTAASASAIAPFLMSVPGIGYESTAYVWAGYGVWAQLCASWALPLAWGFSFRAMRDHRAIFPAIVLVSLTLSLHYETGYLAFVPLALWPFLVPSELAGRVLRSALVGVGSVMASAWVIYPVLSQSAWVAQNQILHGTGLEDGYGARTVFGWLIGGRLFDNGRAPVITCLLAVGLAASVIRWRQSLAGRALVTIWCAALVLTFGRTTFGSVYGLVPGSQDIFIRRFQMGVQLSGIMLAGIGVVTLGGLAWHALRRLLPEASAWLRQGRAGQRTTRAVSALALFVLLTPAWSQLDRYDALNARNIHLQESADHQHDNAINGLLAYVRLHPNGRLYAGMPTNWGMSFRVGAVPVFKYLESQDIDEVGYTLRTASLMTDPEYFFDERNPGDFPLFGVGYILSPEGRPTPVSASLVACAQIYCLWRLPHGGYVHLYRTIGVLTATRADLGTKSVPLLRSPILGAYQDLTVAFNGGAAARRTAASSPASDSPGRVLIEHDDLPDGQVNTTIHATTRSIVVLSASYDPGWAVTVDNRAAVTQMIAPALVGVEVPPGTHVVEFRYGGFGLYTVLWSVSGLAVVGAATGTWLWDSRLKRRAQPGPRA
jgi:hypothetical protein